MTVLITKLHHYAFDSAKHPEYKAMVSRIQANADGCGHWMNSWGSGRNEQFQPHDTTETVEVELQFLFGNQWNTADGRRVFDWYQEYCNDQLIRGHWLEITPEMANARRITQVCGYCGKHYGPYHSPAPGPFCTACLDSEYLKPADFKLLRLQSVADKEQGGIVPYRELTKTELADLMPRYIERQTTGENSRAKQVRDKERADVLAKFEKTTRGALAERDGLLWLWERGIRLDNVIYYDHTAKFSFGWRSPLAEEVKSKLLDTLSEFPFDYEFAKVKR